MPGPADVIVELETRFWQALVDEDADTAANLLTEPAIVVGPHGTLRFDRAEYRRMATAGPLVLRDFAFRDLQVTFPRDAVAVLTYAVTQPVGSRRGGASTVQDVRDSSVWLRHGTGWKCVLHTETPGNGADGQSGISGSTSRRS